jgi:hypothetical protein
MNYFSIEPEVAGSRGPNHKADRTSHPPTVTHLHHEFDGWLGDELLELFPCHIVTDTLANKLQGLTGFQLAPVEVSFSEQFHEVVPPESRPKSFPRWHWLQVNGKPWVDDFFLLPSAILVVSDAALEKVRASVRFAEIEPIAVPDLD